MIVEKKLRILFVTNNYTPYSGGVVSSINAMVDQLQNRGHKVFIITLDFLKSRNADPYYVLRVPSLFSFKYKKNYIAIPLSAYRFICAQVALIKPDIIHVHHPFLLGKVACKVAREQGIPVVFTYHSLYEQYVHYVPLPSCISRPIVMNRVISFCQNVDGIIVPSVGVYNFLCQQHISTQKIIIPSPILPIFLVQDRHIKRVEEPIRLLSVGRFTREKNLTFLCDVMRLLPDKKYILTFVGYGSEYESLVHYAFKKIGLSPQSVKFVLQPSKDLLQKIYQEAHAFLFSSTSDTQGLVLAEAMAGGTPVIAVDGPGQRDIVVDGHNGFLVGSREHMASTIEHLFQDEDAYELMCKNAYTTAQRYAPELIVQQVLDFYMRMLV